jgi:pimeloyl-ACP methyl ester carboxylesterase
MKKVRIHGAELAYRDEGSGKPIVFLHAFPLNQTMWDDQVSALASDYRVISCDWRGFGQSTLGDGISSLETFADDVAGLLRELSLSKAVICGLSMGGYGAFAFYRKYSQMVTALILADTKAGADTEEGKKGRSEMAELARSKGPSALVEIMTPRLLGESTLKNDPNAVKRVKTMIESAQAEGIAQALTAMADRPDSTELLSQINRPTLIIVGKEDKLTPPSEAEKMNQAIAGSALELVQNCGHLPNIERPESFNRAVRGFLGKL